MKNTCAGTSSVVGSEDSGASRRQAVCDLKNFLNFGGAQTRAGWKAHLISWTWSWDPHDPGKPQALGPLGCCKERGD